MKIPPPGFETLSVDEQIDYVQALWDRIAAKPKAVPVPHWHQEVLDQRLADLECDPDEGMSWEAFRAELESKDDSRHR